MRISEMRPMSESDVAYRAAAARPGPDEASWNVRRRSAERFHALGDAIYTADYEADFDRG